MAGHPSYLEAREKVETGSWTGPNLFIASPHVVGRWPWSPKFANFGIANTPEEAKAKVPQFKKERYYEIELTIMVKKELYDAIFEAVREIGIIIRRDDLEWKFIYEGDSPEKWVPTYGFGFTINALRGSSIFTKQQAVTSVFGILKSRGPKAIGISYVPAVLFTYFPSKRQFKCWNRNLTEGVGFDLVQQVIYFGYNELFWHNIGFSTGLAFQQQNVLRDQFEVNDKVSMFMDTGQLHQKVYRPNLFISIHFRLDKNPFNKE